MKIPKSLQLIYNEIEKVPCDSCGKEVKQLNILKKHNEKYVFCSSKCLNKHRKI